MARLISRRTSQTILTLLALFLIGTIVFLWAVKSYFSIDAGAIILPEELGTWEEIQLGAPESSLSWKARYPWLAKALSLKPAETAALDAKSEVEFSDAIAKHAAEAAKAAGFGADAAAFIPTGRDNTPRKWNPATDPPEKIPRIIHQTWKEKTLPPMWQAVRDECAKMHPDYEYKLWTDADSRQFLVEHYPWFIPIFDAYPYSIQRADAIRYFILHHFGGIYMDLDVGCLRRLDPLLRFEIVLPKTIPVGVSNDVMAAARNHPFMDHLIHNLVTFNHRYLTHYPTVMFSTGPMFVSASYGLYVDAHGPSTPSTPANPSAGFRGIRVLPKPLYGKNARPSEAPDAFFRHFYGSSWHAGDADFLIFLREHGRLLIFIGIIIVAYGMSKTVLPRMFGSLRSRRGDGRRRRSSSRRGKWVSLPFIRDPRSGQYRSVPTDLFAGGSSAASSSRAAPRARNLLDEGTQTSNSPLTSVHAAEALGRTTDNDMLAPGLRVAAPRPQRASMPMFELREGEAATGSDDEVDLGPGLDAERMAREKGESLGTHTGGGILNWMQGAYEGAGSTSEGQSLLHTGSASKFKEKASSVLYLPAYLVGASSASSADSSTTDSALASVRVGDDDDSSVQSMSESPSSRTGTPGVPPWGLTRLHSRTTSANNGGFSNWAASFLGSGNGASSSRHNESALSKAWGNVSLNGRTPSPGLFLGNTLRTSRRPSVNDLESGGSDTSTAENLISEKATKGGSADFTEDDEAAAAAAAAYPLAVSTGTKQRFEGASPAEAPEHRRRGSYISAFSPAGAEGSKGDDDSRARFMSADDPSLHPLVSSNIIHREGSVPPPPYHEHVAASAAPSASAPRHSIDDSEGDIDDVTPTLTAKRIVGKRS